MTPEELLRPRYKVIADYPACPYEIGTILIPDEQGELYSTVAGYSASVIKVMEGKAGDFPHLFKPLAWWEERMPEEFTGFVKTPAGDIKRMEMYNDGVILNGCKVSFVSLRQCVPATREEYKAYLDT